MYLIKCDGHLVYDPRQDQLKVLNASCNLKVNSVCGASFTILKDHPHYGKLQKLKSVIEIYQDDDVIFRGRMTNDSMDFYKQLAVDVEGVLACTNDTIIPPFNFPDGFPDAPGEGDEENAVEYFLSWILNEHNKHAQEWQKLKLGTVTVKDPNNVIVRSSENHASTWETLQSKLFESALGGYLYVRYEPDGNYVDYVESFQLTNLQRIRLKDNVLDIVTDTDGNETYTAILPLGKDGLTIGSLEDGDLTDDLAKEGEYIYSRSGIAQYGWICVPIGDGTWDDVTTIDQLRDHGIERLAGNTLKLASTITIRAVDLHFADDEIPTIKVYRNIMVDIPTHEIRGKTMPLTELDIDLLNPQNTVIVLGDTVWSWLDINQKQQQDVQNKVEKVQYEAKENITNVVELEQQLLKQTTQVMNDCNKIILAALESYVETSNFEAYKETVSTQLQILADEIVMQFTSVVEQVNNVDGDLQAEITQRLKHITFSDDGIIIGAGENAMQLKLDNDMIRFMKNGMQFGWWDGVDFHTGNIVVDVNERAQFGNFAFVPRSDGSLMFLKVGG